MPGPVSPSLRGVDARPVAIPDDVDDRISVKATGRVRLPFTVYWSGSSPAFDLDDRRDRAYVYQVVLREGTDDDVRRFIDVDELIRLWDDLWLPRRVRAVWAKWLREHRGVDLPF